MRPYARNGKKIRINNRKKFSARRGKISWEYRPRDHPPRISPLSLMLTRYKRIEQQGLTKKQRARYAIAML